MSDVLYELAGRVGLLTLNRPESMNALSIESIRRLEELSREVQEDDECLVLVVTGAGDRAFCSGGDLDKLLPAITRDGLEVLFPDPSRRFFSDVYKPVIAAVNGLCVGGGLELMLGTDLRVASEQATFALGEVRWGLIPGGGTHIRLPQQVPWVIAMQLLLTGEPIDARRAHEVGLVNELAVPGDVLPRAMQLAEGIARNAPVAVRTAKEIAVRALDNDPSFRLEYELNGRVLATEDALEGPRAFSEKRPPRFRGR
jgi:enoyl-CoA hydratase/carnithine racemase